MATAPVKSQPLHNFSLSLLKWGNKNQMNNHRCRRRESPPEDRRSPASEQESESERENAKTAVGSRPGKNRFGVASCSSVEKSQKHAAKESVETVEEEKEKEKEKGEGDEKPWNLRPRRAVGKVGVEIGGGGLKSGGELQNTVPAVTAAPAVQQNENLPKSMRLRGFAEAQGTEKKEKRKFWISLSRDEIEEDIFVMTGSKPARRPRKRAKNVQKNLDNVFPGLWLVGLTPDAYRVPDAPAKR
ncbi:uncharacterized protein LOC131164575 [Malania oleifera]|uniref:uncharacterized protein LOC131164575 n=1 Tax=Malania oleifera TaxID=397392 RepID=UPI0025AEB7EB|nr:uncharacterized protein LOC131164575 [Malania oleifera]XP_057977852.1 uncharacterized protein LOC131164575 [Malania oleifera]